MFILHLSYFLNLFLCLTSNTYTPWRLYNTPRFVCNTPPPPPPYISLDLGLRECQKSYDMFQKIVVRYVQPPSKSLWPPLIMYSNYVHYVYSVRFSFKKRWLRWKGIVLFYYPYQHVEAWGFCSSFSCCRSGDLFVH